MKKEDVEQKLVQLRAEREQVRANLSAYDGGIQVMEMLIKEWDTPSEPNTLTVVEGGKDGK